MNTAQRLLRTVLLLALIALPAALMGCDSNEEEKDPTADGSWTGSTIVNAVPISLDLTMVENSRIVTGTGSFNVGTAFSVDVNGTHNYPDISLTIRDNLGEQLNFKGLMAGDGRQIAGNVTGASIPTFAITLRKQ